AALALGENLVRRFPSTPYAALAALTLADMDLEIKNFTAARTYLHWVMDHARQPGLRRVARLRLAQVLQAEGKTDAALAMLQQAKPGPFAAAYDELEGDLYRAQGKLGNARAAYRKALDALPANAGNRALLQTKLDDVAAAGAQGGRP
ncbi:MAG: tetratricopeptide repeat protein, partial [Gammaproteobacteria bacterium]|nr:tetratricopeptide repeat protein [Gammaproteobacteria bacterium]